MAKVRISGVTDTNHLEPTWHTYHDDGDGDPVQVALMPWNRTTQAIVDARVADKRFVDELEIDWDRMPKGTGKKKLELRTVILADFLINGAHNFEIEQFERGAGGKVVMTGVKLMQRGDELSIYDKAYFFNSNSMALWLVNKAEEGGVKVVEEDAGN